MRPLNRPMFKYGGPIKEGIMTGMQDRQGYQDAGRVGQYFTNLGKKSLNLLNPLKKIPGAKQIMGSSFVRGLLNKPGGGFVEKTVPKPGGIFTLQRLQNMLPSQRFRTVMTGEKVPLPGGGFRTGTRQLSPLEVLRNPEAIGRAMRENPILTYLGAGQIKNLPDILEGGFNVGTGVVQAGTNYLLGTEFGRNKGQEDIEVTEGSMTRGTGGPKNIGEVSTDTNKKVKTEGEKSRINEDRIQQTKDRYYKMMGLDNMKKDAVYDSLINASKIVSEEGADLKGAIKSGTLQNRLIQAIGKNLDKSADLKKAIDSAVLKGEIQKDINLTKPSAFAEQVQYLRNNPNDPLARKLSGVSSVADNLAALADKPLTSDIVSRLIESKGQDVKDVIKDDKFQKWEKSNEGKDEIDYLQDVYKGKKLDAGVYIINKKAFQIDATGEVNPIDLDSIIG